MASSARMASSASRWLMRCNHRAHRAPRRVVQPCARRSRARPPRSCNHRAPRRVVQPITLTGGRVQPITLTGGRVWLHVVAIIGRRGVVQLVTARSSASWTRIHPRVRGTCNRRAPRCVVQWRDRSGTFRDVPEQSTKLQSSRAAARSRAPRRVVQRELYSPGNTRVSCNHRAPRRVVQQARVSRKKSGFDHVVAIIARRGA